MAEDALNFRGLMVIAKSVILYVEDEETDRFLMEYACKQAGLGPTLRMVNHGQAAIDYLSGAGTYGDREKYPMPAVVLLDLNLPEVHGFEVLKWIRGQPGHSRLPVVVFTSSSREEDRSRAEQLGANGFIQKPLMPDGFQAIARQLNEQWLRCSDSCEDGRQNLETRRQDTPCALPLACEGEMVSVIDYIFRFRFLFA